jgi:predicted dehydrogenase
MFDQMGSQIDAVTVSTPDHMHFPIAVAALSLGKHVFVEKPLTHTIAEARQLAQLARTKGVATQMGNQGHAGEGVRLLKEWFDAGVLGEVREVFSWTNRPIWPQGVQLPDHSKMMPVVPATLDWNLWLGVAQPLEYDPAYVPFSWRGFWSFGTGALGDMGCHVMDGVFYALALTAPVSVEAFAAQTTDVSAPTAAVINYHFPARANLPAVTWHWSDGAILPPLPLDYEQTRNLPESGSLIVGSRATVLADTYYDSIRVIPEARMRQIAPTLPPKTIPRVAGGHFAEWIRACKGGPPAGASFDYASRLTETVLLGNVALRARRRIDWDSASLQVTNLPEANRYLRTDYRPGFLPAGFGRAVDTLTAAAREG